MSLNFPSRFLKKLNIYQQIRKGEGISNHKHLWKYEAAFLQCSYGKDHQHLSSCVNREDFKKWIEKINKFNPEDDQEELNHIIANLYFRGYIDVIKVSKLDKKIIKKEIYDKKNLVFSGDMLDDKSLEFRASTKGLLIGEVVNEINNKSIILREFNIYKYNLILDTLWLLIFAVPMGFVLNNNSAIKWFNEVDFVLCVAFWLWFIFLFWPSLLFILRKIYSFLDKPHNE